MCKWMHNFTIGPVKHFFSRKIAIIFLSISINMCFGCSKEQSHRESSFEYPQHMFWMRNKNNKFQVHTLIWGPVLHSNIEFIYTYACYRGVLYSIGRRRDTGKIMQNSRTFQGQLKDFPTVFKD